MKDFISNAKQLSQYSRMTPNEKRQFWIMLPIVYFRVTKFEIGYWIFKKWKKLCPKA